MYQYQVTPVTIHDGDTFRGDIDLGFYIWLHAIDFRLNRINTPEITGVQKPRGMLSRDRLMTLMPLHVPITVKVDKPDKYGRWLADIYLATGQCVNDMLVAEDLAKYYTGEGPKPV